MQRIYCHNCSNQFTVPAEGEWNGTCPRCLEGFVEVLGLAPAPGLGGGGASQRGYHGSFTLPGGAGTVQVFVGSGPDLGGLGMGGRGYMGPGGNPFELLRALMSGTPLPPNMMFNGGFGADYDQEQMDRVVTQIMNQYQPQSRETARRVRDTLPRLRVRPQQCRAPAGQQRAGGSGTGASPATEEEEMGVAAVCAGEPCSVCHDEFEEGKEVLELPCNHCFHEDCLMPWLEMHNTCPVCRLELPAEGEHGRRPDGGGAGGSRGPPRGQGAQQQQGGGEGWMGSLNQLLHDIAERWEQSQGQGDDEQQRRRRQQRGEGGIGAPTLAPAQTVRPMQQQRQQREEEEEEDVEEQPGLADTGVLGLAIGGVVAALVGGAVSAFLGRGRQRSRRE